MELEHMLVFTYSALRSNSSLRREQILAVVGERNLSSEPVLCLRNGHHKELDAPYLTTDRQI